jgi:hypothetical protein
VHIVMSEIEARIPPGARVLDLGGWERVFPRANVVVDLMPYSTRKVRDPNTPEQFTKDDWIEADFTSPSFWNSVPDKAFDFVTIGHTLEDIRDPLYVCSQMIRCAKAGYIEAPSRFRELSKERANDTLAGYPHHRWIIAPMPDLTGLLFKAKLHWAHHRDYLGAKRRYMIRDYFHQWDGYFWEGSFRYEELIPKGVKAETEDAEFYFKYRVKEHAKRNNLHFLVPNSSSDRDGRCLWPTQYELDCEYAESNGRFRPSYPDYY